jgi:hypothetical protein
MIIRIGRGIGKHFATRATEWGCTAVLFLWGVRLTLFDDDVFGASASMIELRRVFSEDAWGAMCFVVGSLRICALILNGTFEGEWYSRFSPHVRSVMAFLSCFFWLTITLGIISAGMPSTGICVYPVLLAGDIWNTGRALIDADRSHRNVPSS